MNTGILHFSNALSILIVLLLGIFLNLGSVHAQKSITVTNNDGSNSKQKIEQIIEKNLNEAIEKNSQLSSCNFYSEIEISNISEDNQPVDEVGCSNNDTLQVCIRILQFETSTPGNGCQYLHGLVPEWGCLSPLEPTADGEPGIYTVPMTNNTGSGQWLWYPDGVVTYNQPGGYYAPFEPVGAGWFYTFSPGNLPTCQDYSNPNCTWGDGVGCNSSGFVWEVCFLAELACLEFDLDAGPNPCTFSFRTFSDGETGGYDVMGCQDDQPYEYSFIGECCDEPIVLNDTLDFEICSGDEFNVDFISNMDPETTYDWVVIPNPHGATSGSGTGISQVLTNTTADQVTVTYFVTPTCAMGCVGETFTINVTINPEVNVQADGFYGPICDFDCVPISAIGSEGVPPYSYQWSDGQNSASTVVCPFPGLNIYTVTITDSNGCTNTDELYIEVVETPFIAISASSLEDCNSVTLTANVIFGGFGNYFYEWSNGSTSQSITVTNSGTYSVVVYDGYSGCESFPESATVIIHDEPEVNLDGPEVLCLNSGLTCFTANPIGGVWSGAADPNGCVEPAALGVGIHQVEYFYTDINSCQATEIFSFEVIESLTPPNPLPNVEVCNDVQNLSFTINEVAGASSYLWTTTGSITLGSGQGNSTVAVELSAAGSGTVCVNADGNCGLSDEMCFDIVVNEIPTSEFTLPNQVCVNQGAPVSFSGITDPNATFNWDFGGGTPSDNNPGMNPFDITWSAAGIYNVSLQIESAGCISEVYSLPIQVLEDLPLPAIYCTSTISTISFFWDDVPGATGYLVNGNSSSGNEYTVTGLNPGETISISVIAINGGICGDSESSASCTTEECNAIIIDIEEVGTLCEDAGSIELQVSYFGGTGTGSGIWSGAGIIDPIGGIFDPIIAGIGSHTLTYQLFEGQCSYSESVDVTVEDASSESLSISCSATIDVVTFIWNAIPGVSEYLVNGQIQNETSYSQNTTPGEVVSITVETVGAGLCGEVSASQTCQAEECPPLVIVLSGPSVICLETSPITLQANEPNGIWSGSCVTDSINGIFDPSLGQPGVNIITYVLSIGQCIYSSSLDILVDEPIDQPSISCSSTLEEVSFAWADVSGATGYLVNGNFQNGTAYSENVGPGETVTITVEAISNNSCPSTIASASCTSEECEGGLVLTSVGPICQDNGLLVLEANISGGLWSGPGVIDPFSGTFDPNIAQQGIHTISYIINTGPCNADVTMEIEVQAVLDEPEINCSSTVESVSFSWQAITGASAYLVNGVEQVATSITFNTSPNESVTIEVEAMSNGVCSNSISSLTCTSDECPTVSIDIMPVENICLGESPLNNLQLEVNIQGSSEQGFWSGPGIIDPVYGYFDPNAADIGSHEIIYQIQNGICTYSQIKIVEISAPPIVEAGNAVTLTCDDPVLLLAGSAQGNLEWSGPGLIFGSNSTEPMVNESGMYIFTVTDPLTGCAASDEVEVFENFDTPVAIASPDQFLTCTEEIVSLSVQGGLANNTSLQWSGPGINQDNESEELAFVDVPGVYLLTIKNEDNGCVSEPDSVVVSQNTIPPVVDAAINGAIDCNDSPVSLLANIQTAVVYTWMLPDNEIVEGEFLEVNEAGNYILIGESLFNGCTASQTFEIENEEEIPVANAGVDQMINCNTSQVVLNGNDSESGAAFEYLWTGPNGAINGPNDILEIETEMPGLYVLQVTNTLNNCVGLDTVRVEADLLIPEVEAGETQEFKCNDLQLALSGMASEEVGGVVWRHENGAVLSTALNSLIETPGWYYLTATNLENGCSNLDSVLITQDMDVPYAFEIEATGVTCYGDEDGTIEINNILGGSSPYQYAIGSVSYGDFNFRDNLAGGTYEISVMDADGCLFSENVVVPEQSEMSLDLGDEIVTGLGEEHIVDAQMGIDVGAIESVIWAPAEEVDCLDENCLEVSLSPLSTTTFQMMVMDTSGCMAEAELQVRLVKERQVYFPNIFTPNDDGFNDRFYIQGKAEKINAVRQFVVMDRWGNTVYQNANFDLNDSTYGWDGLLKNKKVQPGVFVYFAEIEFIDGHVEMFKGEVTMVY